MSLGDVALLTSMVDNFPQLKEVLKRDRDILCPRYEDMFRAIKLVDNSDMKVLIVGSEPSSVPSLANGLAFGMSKDYKGSIDPSLAAIKQELYDSTGQTLTDYTLEDWANQGVLLLNTVLTTVEGSSESHANLGWEEITREIIESANNKSQPIVFMLWGRQALRYYSTLDNYKSHLVLEASHPLTSSFKGCNHFSKANEWLVERGIKPIKWGRYDQ